MSKKNKMTKKIRKGDSVIVLTGADKGKTGDVLRVFPKEQRVIVQGTNLVKRHNQPSANNPGGIDEKEAPIHVSNVAIVDPEREEKIVPPTMATRDRRPGTLAINLSTASIARDAIPV